MIIQLKRVDKNIIPSLQWSLLTVYVIVGGESISFHFETVNPLLNVR